MKKPTAAPSSRKPYRQPRLTVFGGVAELTRGGKTSTMTDHGMNMMWPS